MNVYADNAATTRLGDTALAAMIPCFQEVYGNPSSLHSPGQRAAEKLAEAGIFLPAVSMLTQGRSPLPLEGVRRTTKRCALLPL